MRDEALGPRARARRAAVARRGAVGPAALSDYRKKEDEALTSWGWVEKDRGIARMPVAEAMKIVGERGALPAFLSPAPSPSPAAAGGAR